MAAPVFGPCPPRFVELKRTIAESYPDFEKNVTKAWNEVLEELKVATEEFATKGPEVRVLGFSPSGLHDAALTPRVDRPVYQFQGPQEPGRRTAHNDSQTWMCRNPGRCRR